MNNLHWFTSSSGRIEFQMTLEQAHACSHSGSCDADVEALSKTPLGEIVRRIEPALLANELREYGAWDADELADHEANVRRILWLAAGEIVDHQGATP